MFVNFGLSPDYGWLAVFCLGLVVPAGAVVPRSGASGTPPILLTAGNVTISAPGTVDPGQAVEVTIAGSRGDGRIEIWGPVSRGEEGRLIESIPAPAGAAALNAPAEPGTYELRYFEGPKTVRARFILDVAGVPIMLSVPGYIGAGYDAKILWRGPGSAGDMIQIYDPAHGAVLAEAPAAGRMGAENTTILRFPERTGSYEIRYWSGAWRVALRSLPIHGMCSTSVDPPRDLFCVL